MASTLTTPPRAGMFRTDITHAAPVRVDRYAHAIFGASLMQVGDLNAGDARNWTVTADSLLQAYTFAIRGNNGLKARFTHPNMSSDGLGSYLGRWKNFKLDGDTLRADLFLADAAFRSPNGDIGTYVMDMAENDPDMFGVSLATELDEADLAAWEDACDLSGSAARWHMKFTAIRSGDVVDEPAATRGGMFDLSEPDLRNLPAQATALLSTYFGDASPDVVRSRIDSFLTRYFETQGVIMPDTAPPATPPATAATETPPGNTVPATVPATVTPPVTPPVTPETPTTPPTATPAAAPVAALGTARGLGDFMDAFGDAEGARMFRAGTTFDAAMLQHLAACKGQIQDLSAENAQLKANLAAMAKSGMGETTPVNVGDDGARKSFSEACRGTNRPR